MKEEIMKERQSSWLGQQIVYTELGGKEQESYNAAQLISMMAQYGYLESAKINGDKWGPDLLFYRSSDADVKKVQLKGRATFAKHYMGKDIHIAFPLDGHWYMYPHDEMAKACEGKASWIGTESWKSPTGGYSWGNPPRWMRDELEQWRITP